MKYRCKMTEDVVSAETWGPAFTREFDKVVAQNVMSGLRDGRVVYDVLLDARVAHFCARFDGGLVEDFRGVQRVARNPEAPYLEDDPYLDALVGTPRGTWTILEKDGNYVSYMSDGYGGIGSPGGAHAYADSPSLAFEATYASVLGWMAYKRRQAMKTEILEHSAALHVLPVGTVATDKRLGGKEFSKVELREPMDGKHVVKATKRGIKSLHFALPPGTYCYVFDAPIALPPRYASEDGIDRTTTLQERRIEVAKAEYDRLAQDGAISGKPPVGFRAVAGDAVVGLLDHRQVDYSLSEFQVDFAPDATDVVSTRPAPSRGMNL